jgi:hypothetical protein
MLPESVIEHVVESQKERLSTLDTGIPRDIYGYENLTSHAYIISGVRRCGKSTVLQQINKKSVGQSVYINFEDPRLAGFDLSDFNRLQNIAEKGDIKNFFFDEIQLVSSWENYVRFRLDEGYRIFISGSNASMLSKELGTKLTGRHITKELFPFSYKEFLTITNQQKGEVSTKEYIVKGGFPEFLKTGMPEILMQVFNDIIVRDIAVRYNIRNSTLLQQVAVWLISNIGKPFSGNNLRKIYNIPSSSSIMEYLTFLSDAYLFFFIPKFSYSPKVQIVNPKKVYCIDNGLIKINSLSFNDDYGRLFENMIYLCLRRFSSEIYYFSENKECDFVVFKNHKIYGLFQSCYTLDDNNFTRETNGLIEAMEYFNFDSGYIITLNQTDEFLVGNKKITVLPFYKWNL